jgi:hypothetical protein
LGEPGCRESIGLVYAGDAINPPHEVTVMNAMPRTTNAERAGRWLGRAWRRFVRQEARAIRWLTDKGLPVGTVRVLLWIVKLAVLGVLLYATLWLVLLLALAVVTAWLLRNAGADEEKQPELRDGHSGIGVYDKDDWRIDMGDPDEP